MKQICTFCNFFFQETASVNKTFDLPLAKMESRESIVNWFLQRYTLDWDYHLTKSPWEIPPTWITSREIHPEHTPQLGEKILTTIF